MFVEGRLQSRSWEDTTGGKRSVVEVRAERVQFLSLAPAASGAREQSQPDADVISEVSPQQIDSDSLQEG